MDLSELSALRAGLKLFSSTVNEVARRAEVSPTYVKHTLSGSVKSWRTNPTCQRIIAEAKSLFAEREAAIQRYKCQMSVPEQAI